MRVNETFDASVQFAQLLLHPRARLLQAGKRINQIATSKDRRQQIFTGGLGREMFAAGLVERIDDGKVGRQPAAEVINGVSGKFLASEKAADLKDTGVGDF